MAIVSSIQSRWILDSRGLPTVWCEVTLDQNGKKASGSAAVPSGASTGSYEALELRDKSKEFHGKGVKMAIENVTSSIGNQIGSRNFNSASEIDSVILEIDKTGNKSNLGANATLAVSMAAHRAFANLYNLDLWQYLRRLYFSDLPVTMAFPRLMCNVVNGGAHADNNIDIQEFMIVPNTQDIESDIQMASEVYHTLKKNLHSNKLSTALGDEGGFAPNFDSAHQVLSYLQQAIFDSGYNQNQCSLALDVAANELFDSATKTYKMEGNNFNYEELVAFYQGLKRDFDILSIEDGCQEDDFVAWDKLTTAIGDKTFLIGDDLFVTNPKRFSAIALEKKVANGVLIKLNQIGTVLETCEMINLAKTNKYVTAISHRSGETNDAFISDLAFASQSEFIKLGAPARGERVAKFNRLLEIKDSLVQ